MDDDLIEGEAHEIGEGAEQEAREQLEALRAKQKAQQEKLIEALGRQVQEDFDLSKQHRIEIERRWVEDLRQYKGSYDPETEARLAKNRRSRIFLRLTRAKVKSTNARMGDMLFPAGDKNWSLTATPIPDVDPDSYQSEMQAIQAMHGQLDGEALKEAVNQVAKDRCEKMGKVIDDQLIEGNYEAECRKVIMSGNLFGTGILKGPMGSPKHTRRWRKRGSAWTLAGVPEMKPGFCFVPVWHYYPDPEATSTRECRFEIQARPMKRADFAELKNDSAFMADRVDMVLARFPEGESRTLEQWEADLRNVNKAEANKPLPTHRYMVLERWGEVSGAMLKACGAEVDETKTYEGQVWVCGGIVIRAQINPYDSGSRPFKLYYLDKDESSIWGEGIPSIMRDTQRGANTSVRALVDNAAASAIPMFEVNTDLLSEESDLDTIAAGRVWKRKGRGVDSQYPAVRPVEIPAKTEQFMSLLRLFIEMGDEVTTMPRYTYGGGDGSGVSKTVGGLSMLMGQANISLKDLVKNWDDGITEPFISDCYAWNMQFNPDEDIKGDYDVTARGSSSLVAKEVRANALAQFTMDILNGAPEIAKKRELYAERARNLDLNPDVFMLSQQEVDQADMGRAAQEALVKLAESMGLEPGALVQNMDQFIAQAKQMLAPQPTDMAAPGAMVPGGVPAEVMA